MAEDSAAALVADRCGAHLLVRERHETVDHAGRFAWPPVVDGQLFVLVSPVAARNPSVFGVLPDLVGVARRETGALTVRIGLPRLGAHTAIAQRLADRLGTDLFAADGGFLDRPGAALFAGHGTGGTGWRLFRPGQGAEFGGMRHPRPGWELAVAAQPFVRGPVAVEPVPAGLVVRDLRTAPTKLSDPVAWIPVDPRAPRVFVGGQGVAPSPAAVAEVLRSLPESFVLVPGEPAVAGYAWLAETTLRLGRDLVTVPGGFSTAGPGNRPPRTRFPSFATLLRQPMGGGDQVVLDVVPPPAGWERVGPSTYGLGDVRADVVPSGLVVRSGAADPASTALPFDPAGWTLQLGTPGSRVDRALLHAVEKLLSGLDPALRARARFRVAGEPDDSTRAVLSRLAAPGGPSTAKAAPHRNPVPVDPAPAAPAPIAQAPAAPAAEPVTPAAPPHAPAVPSAAAAARIATMSAMPIPTVSGMPGTRPGPAEEAPPARREEPAPPPPAEPRPVTPPAAGGPPSAPEPSPYPPEPLVPPAAQSSPGRAGTDPAPGAPPVPVAPRRDPLSVAPGPTPLAVADRGSKATEQASFTAAAGHDFSEALATVNAALATWPSMRQDDSAGVKADYAAVCLFLGEGRGGAQAVNGAVRSGQENGLPGQLECLSSGIRRLPMHRRPVLRQSRSDEPVEPGSVHVEPGFLTASLDLDVTVTDAAVDVLIWPATARRTTELLGQRTPDEVVFGAGARFKALAVRRADDSEDPDVEGPRAPRIAVLLRELAPGEVPGDTTELDERDQRALGKLDAVLARRRKNTLRLVDGPGAVARLTSPLVEWDAETMAAPGRAGGHSTVMAS
ncbi:hypothetical protein GCM10027598_52830 [Amycolatopsis oliviviridis]|uniref:Basic proline-rich protein n=1 Tax=Amycolatopsis oliviviridis TaxID=1471590 RepID=A0ABQ3MCN7_9PSEU|nr:hypothetical protein [Amycolatopsis oliviviridis]GHH38369.1 hypothetical protein GCM10017790_83980 [Amycolatopsis oliviviridis]